MVQSELSHNVDLSIEFLSIRLREILARVTFG